MTTEADGDVVTAMVATNVGVDVAVVDEVETVTGTDVTIGAEVDASGRSHADEACTGTGSVR